MIEATDLHTIILELKELGIGYKISRKTHILHDRLNLSLHRGDLVCMIGPNGSGKSTLIRTIGGLQPSINGIVSINGNELQNLSISERSKLLSIVLTEKTAVENISVGEIVALGRYAQTNWLGSLNDQDLQIIRSSLSMVGLNNFEDRYYGTLSDGEKQRTFIAKALASNAPLMLLDEPTAHLDIPNRVEIMTLLRELTRSKQQSILVSTHDLDLALQLADEIWLLEKDKIILCTTPEEAISTGIINDCFGNRSVEFHPDFGRFVIKSKPIGSIFVTGEGVNYELTRKALERVGFAIDSDKTAITIHVEKQNWTLNHRDKSFKADRLSDIIRLVRKHSDPIE
jgi:iron complex transport system ATP-binding protein